jgi:hypothetical protein
MRLFCFMQPRVVEALSAAVSKVYISFDGWTTKGGKRGFFGIIAHFADAAGVIRDLPIDLPQLQGSHSGERIAETVKRTLETYGIFPSKLGYFVLDNATNNDTAVAAIARLYNFNAANRRLRYGPHTLNLIGQAIIFGKNKEAYDNVAEEHASEQAFMAQWRRDGSLGDLMNVINYIKTPQQYELFADFQRLANRALPTHNRLKYLSLLSLSSRVGTRSTAHLSALLTSTLPTTHTQAIISAQLLRPTCTQFQKETSYQTRQLG